jgi:nitrite reductase/ring-hydroxylating ferredoxin subunit
MSTDACRDCPLHGDGTTRRVFLQEAGGGLIAAIMVAITATNASAGTAEKRYPIPASDGATIDRDTQVILVRYQNHVIALALACPHQNAAVKWLPSDGRFQCTKHDSRYTPDGVHTSGRATRNMDRFPITRDGASVVVDVSRVFRSDQDAAGWAGAAVGV